MRTEQQLVDKITFEELAYRNGKPNISDSEFEAYVDELRTFYPKNHILSTIVGEVISGTKVKLPVPMGSLEKIKTEEDLRKWIEHHNLMDEILVITPKYDGISIYKGQNLAITRGDEGIEGTDVTNRLLKTLSLIHI